MEPPQISCPPWTFKRCQFRTPRKTESLWTRGLFGPTRGLWVFGKTHKFIVEGMRVLKLGINFLFLFLSMKLGTKGDFWQTKKKIRSKRDFSDSVIVCVPYLLYKWSNVTGGPVRSSRGPLLTPLPCSVPCSSREGPLSVPLSKGNSLCVRHKCPSQFFWIRGSFPEFIRSRGLRSVRFGLTTFVK